MRRPLVCAAILGALLLMECSPVHRVRITSGPGVPNEVTRSVTAHLLSNDIPVAGEKDDRISYSIHISHLPAGQEMSSDASLRILHREWLAPVTTLWSPAQVAGEISTSSEPRILPLDSIAPPDRALPDGGKFPGDSGYPWHNDTVVSIRAHSPGAREDPVPAWFSSIPGGIEDPDILWIGAVGDIMVGRGIPELLKSDNGPVKVFGNTLSVLQSRDLLMGNLEGAVTTGGIRAEKSYTFRFSPWILPYLREAGFSYLSLTNNHSFDYGEQGFVDTLRHMEDAGIKTSGAGFNAASAARAAFFTLRGQRISVLSLGAYPREKNGFDGAVAAAAQDERPGILWMGDAADAAITEQVGESSFDILMVHGGVEWSEAPSDEIRALYKGYIDIGVDVVIGSHPHVLQGLESYKNGLIAYSLGNFLFPGMDETRYGEESLILSLGIVDNIIRYVNMIPVRISGTTISIATRGEILERVLDQTKALNER